MSPRRPGCVTLRALGLGEGVVFVVETGEAPDVFVFGEPGAGVGVLVFTEAARAAAAAHHASGASFTACAHAALTAGSGSLAEEALALAHTAGTGPAASTRAGHARHASCTASGRTEQTRTRAEATATRGHVATAGAE